MSNQSFKLFVWKYICVFLQSQISCYQPKSYMLTNNPVFICLLRDKRCIVGHSLQTFNTQPHPAAPISIPLLHPSIFIGESS